MRGGMIRSGTVVSNLPNRSKKSRNRLFRNKSKRLSKKSSKK